MSTPVKSPAAQAFKFAAPRAAKFGVDRNLGILTNVALITAGLEAKGHGIWIDDKTVTTAAAVLAAKDNRFKAAISHLSWADWWDGETDRVMEFPGWFSGAAATPGPTGLMLAAAKLEFYETFKTDQPRLFARLLEMAEKTPDLFGISLEPWGYLVYVGEDGTEYSERPKDIALKYDGLPALRVTELTYGAIVDDPAANPGGLFAALSRKFPKSKLAAALSRMFADEQSESAAAVSLAGLPVTAVPAAIAEKMLGAPAAPVIENPALVNSAASTVASSPSTLAMKDILNHINATFSADKAKHAQALSIFAAKPEITVEALGAAMQQQDLAAATAQVTTLTAANAQLKTDLAAAEKARDEWKGKFETLKGSGQTGELPLGAPSTSAAQDNPWLKGQENLTRQAEITKSNPTLAAQLKATAQTPAPAAPAK